MWIGTRQTGDHTVVVGVSVVMATSSRQPYCVRGDFLVMVSTQGK